MNAEEKAKLAINKMNDTQLFEAWEELTEANSDKYIPMVRGWLMDEIEKRFPVGFGNWLDGDAEGNTLKVYCLG